MNERMKSYLVNTSTRILFYVPAIGVWEKLISDFDNLELLISRSCAVGVNLFAGELQDFSRRVAKRITRTTDASSETQKSRSDFYAGLVVGTITYGIVLAVAGVSGQKAATAMAFALPFTILTGRHYGRFNDRWREKFHLEPVYRTKAMEEGR